jgi:hypothetical protein
MTTVTVVTKASELVSSRFQIGLVVLVGAVFHLIILLCLCHVVLEVRNIKTYVNRKISSLISSVSVLHYGRNFS